MTFFEFVSVAVSLVLALAIAQLLAGLAHAFDAARRYWIHALWVAIKTINVPMIWWSLWALRETTSWSLPAFLLVLSSAAILNFQASILLTAHPESVSNWKTHFFARRTPFFCANALLPVTDAAIGVLLLGASSLSTGLLPPDAAMIVLSFLGAISASPRVHAIIVIAAALNALLGFGLALFRPPGSAV